MNQHIEHSYHTHPIEFLTKSSRNSHSASGWPGLKGVFNHYLPDRSLTALQCQRFVLHIGQCTSNYCTRDVGTTVETTLIVPAQ
jgi:hypothetical protein